jgi:peptidoglycan/LPS O-acetylase OafA/YrhL
MSGVRLYLTKLLLARFPELSNKLEGISEIRFFEFVLSIALCAVVIMRWSRYKLKHSLRDAQEREMRIVITLIILAFALVGFYILGTGGGILWLLFFIVAYPPVLAFTASPTIKEETNLIELYRIGVSQIPFIGQTLSTLFGVRMHNNKTEVERDKERPDERVK